MLSPKALPSRSRTSAVTSLILASPTLATTMRVSVCQPDFVWYENNSSVAAGAAHRLRRQGRITEYQKLKDARRNAARAMDALTHGAVMVSTVGGDQAVQRTCNS